MKKAWTLALVAASAAAALAVGIGAERAVERSDPQYAAQASSPR
jgi:hypothetical protein